MPHSTKARITGTLPGTPATYPVTVTARDGTAVGSMQFRIVTLPSLAASTATTGPVRRPGSSLCLAGRGSGPGAAVSVQACRPGGGQRWSYRSGGRPDGAGSLATGGLCLSLPARLGHAGLAACDGSEGQQWQYLNLVQLRNMRTGTCLTAGQAGRAVVGAACADFRSSQAWALPAGPVVSGAHALCLDNPGNSPTPGSAVTVAACSGTAGQRFRFAGGTFSSASGLCLTAAGKLPGGRVTLATCHAHETQLWFPARASQLINVSTGMCLSDPAAGEAGTALVQQDCYGDPGQVWALN